jgi:hypothetical protein
MTGVADAPVRQRDALATCKFRAKLDFVGKMLKKL